MWNAFILSDLRKNCKCLPLKLNNSMKQLGLYIDQHFSWRNHGIFEVSAFLCQLRSGADIGPRGNVSKLGGISITIRYHSTEKQYVFNKDYSS